MAEDKELEQVATKIFSIIEFVEVSGISGASFQVIRKKLLDAGNDILRLRESILFNKVGEL